MIWHFAFDGVILAVLWFSAWTDIQNRVVYEPLILAGILFALVMNASWWGLITTILVFVASYLVVRTGKLGLGDAEIFALITAAFGGVTVIVVGILAALFALSYALLRMIFHHTRRTSFAMVPFLALGTTTSFLIALGLTWLRW